MAKKIEVLSERGRFGPLPADHPMLGVLCVLCQKSMEAGQAPALVDGIPASPEDSLKMQQGRAYNASCKIAHESCAYQEEP